MSSTRYLEFDSMYRDRVLYPSPSNFSVEMSQSGQGNKLTARDPVSDSSPILIWNNNFVQAYTVGITGSTGTYGSNYIWPIQVSPGPNPGTQGPSVFQIQTVSPTGPALKQVRNFYVGASLARGSDGGYPPATPITARRITEYRPLDLHNALITLDSALPDSVVGSTGFYIANPTPIATDTTGPTGFTNTTIKFYIPGSNSCVEPAEQTQQYGLGSDNFYINYYVMNTDTGTSRKITAFDAVTRLATLESPTTGEDWADSGDNASANFVIRKTIPIEDSGGTGTPVAYAIPRLVQLQDPSNGAVTGQYDGDFLRINPYTNAPTPYNVTTSPPYNTGVTVSYPVNCQSEERRIQRFVYGKGTVLTTGTTTTVILDTTGASTGQEYVGALISNASYNLPPPSYYHPRTAKIIGYNATTREVTTETALTWNNGDQWLIRTCILSSPYSVVPNPQSLYEIEIFSRDNYNPFIYTGSLVSSQEVVCYEVELLNLILPNAILASGRGGRPIFYPYLYVELQQISSAGSANNNIIYSNNPNSYRMLYRAVVDDTPIPAVSPFIKIDGDGMVHVVKFKPNDAFRFAVFHANGEPFRTILDEQYSPSAPNALTQISACFAFKRI